MKKMVLIFSSFFILALVVAGCGSKTVTPDFTTAQFEAALKNGDDLVGKTVSVNVDKLVPDSAFGYNIQTGEHLNFVSTENPNVKTGDKIIVKVTEVKSVMGSFVISYEKI